MPSVPQTRRASPRDDIALYSGLSESDVGLIRYHVNRDEHRRLIEVVQPPAPRGSATTSRGARQHPGSGLEEITEFAERWETVTNPAPPDEDSFDSGDGGGGGGGGGD